MGAETRFESLVCGELGQLLRSPWASLSGKLELPSLPYWRDIISNDGKREIVRIYAGIGNFGARADLSSYLAFRICRIRNEFNTHSASAHSCRFRDETIESVRTCRIEKHCMQHGNAATTQVIAIRIFRTRHRNIMPKEVNCPTACSRH